MAAETRRKEAEAQQAQEAQAAREAEAAEQLAAQANSENALVARQRQRQLAQLRGRYFSAIRQRVTSKWRKPAVGSFTDVSCVVTVVQNIGGTVLRIESVNCSGGGDPFRKSVENAVIAASPLPQAPDRSLFERKIKFTFRPS